MVQDKATPKANFNYPTAYRLGCGRRRELAGACGEFGVRRPLVITDPEDNDAGESSGAAYWYEVTALEPLAVP